MRDMEMRISMKCSICGNDQFSTIDENMEDLLNAPDETEFKCSDCGRVTTKKHLLEDNSHIIHANIEDFEKEIVQKLQKKLKKLFK